MRKDLLFATFLMGAVIATLAGCKASSFAGSDQRGAALTDKGKADLNDGDDDDSGGKDSGKKGGKDSGKKDGKDSGKDSGFGSGAKDGGSGKDSGGTDSSDGKDGKNGKGGIDSSDGKDGKGGIDSNGVGSDSGDKGSGDIGSDDGEVSAKLTAPMTVDQLDGGDAADDAFTVKVTRTTKDGVVKGSQVSADFDEHQAATKQLADACSKNSETYITVEFYDRDHNRTMTSTSTAAGGCFLGSDAAGQPLVGRTGGDDKSPEITTDDGECKCGTCIDRDKDNTFRFHCPNGKAIHIKGIQ